MPTKRGNLLLPRFIPLTFFRGERRDFGPLQASIYRNRVFPDIDDELDEFIKTMKINDFGLLIKSLNRVRVWENPPIEFKKSDHDSCKKGLYLDIEGLAQHYGLSTHYLDFTNDFDVALFFACTKYDAECGTYVPLSDEDIEKSPIGVLYSFPVGIGLTDTQKYNRDRIRILPIQPFLRSFFQSGFTYYDDKGSQPDRIRKYLFHHDKKICDEIFAKFNNGSNLFPDDGLPWLSDEVKKIRDTNCSSEASFRLTCTQKGYRKQRAKCLKSKLMERGYKIGKKPYTISEQELLKYDNDWGLSAYYRRLGFNDGMLAIDTMFGNDKKNGKRVL